MSVAPAFALLAGWLAAAPAPAEAPLPLERAREAFARGEYPAAEQLALEAARPPTQGAALYLAGLARFRAGKVEQALAALDAAAAAPDAPEPAPLQFNRAACLYQLEKFPEAAAAFEAAAADPSLAPVALANAGFAALDGGDPQRALLLARKARATASGSALALVEDLEAQLQATAPPTSAAGDGDEDYRDGLAAYDAGRYADARAAFLRAAERAPSAGRNRVMAGAAALKEGDRAFARAQLRQSLSLELSEREQEIALDYLDLLTPGLRGGGRGGAVYASVGSGFDTNVLQLGAEARELLRPSGLSGSGSAVLSASLALAYRARTGRSLFAEIAYSGEQRAYLNPQVADYSLQQHAISGALELFAADGLRLGLSGSGEVVFTGLSTFRGLQVSAAAGAWGALDWSEHATTRLDLSAARKLGLGSEFAYLTGTRLDATLSQELRQGPLSGLLWYRLRADRIGTLTQTESFVLPLGTCPSGCTQTYVIPLGWLGHAGGLTARLRLGRLELGADASLEWRRYAAESYLGLALADGTTAELDRRVREDLRLSGGLVAAVRLARFSLSLRYDLVLNHSNVDTRQSDPAHRLDYANERFDKHVLGLELGVDF